MYLIHIFYVKDLHKFGIMIKWELFFGVTKIKYKYNIKLHTLVACKCNHM